MDTKLLSSPESNNTLANCLFRRNIPVTMFGSRVHFLHKGKASSIPTIFNWGGSISPEGFLPSIPLSAVIIVAVAIVVMVVLVVVDAIIRVTDVVVVVGVSSIIKVLFVIIVTVPLILWGNPLIKTSISFSVFGTILGHKTANSWNLLTGKDDDDKSSNDDDNDDDVEKDEEDKEEEEYPASVDPFDVSTDDLVPSS
nr:hypothetical protein [Tanacetum cinerariifolium]